MMKIKVSLTAMIDIEEAAKYYNSQQLGLGRKFEGKIRRTFKRVQQMPYAASFLYDNIRFKIVENFPFIVTYDIFDDTIFILRVFDERQDPQKLK